MANRTLCRRRQNKRVSFRHRIPLFKKLVFVFMLLMLASASILGGALLYSGLDDSANFTHGFCNSYLANVDRSMALLDSVMSQFTGDDVWVSGDNSMSSDNAASDGHFVQTHTDEFAGVWLCDDGYLHVGIATGNSGGGIAHMRSSIGREVDIDRESNISLYSGQVRFVRQRYSLNHLNAIKDALVQRMCEFGIFVLSVDEVYNRVEISIDSDLNKQFIIQYLQGVNLFSQGSHYFIVDKNISVEAASRPIYGGDNIFQSGGRGTIGAAAVCNRTGRLGVLTNHHVIPVGYTASHSINDGQQAMRIGVAERGRRGGTIDASFIPFDNQNAWAYSADARLVCRQLNDPRFVERLTAPRLGGENHIIRGQPTLKLGQTTRVTTGDIRNTNTTVRDGFFGSTWSVSSAFRISNRTERGDSGGPVFALSGGNTYLIGLTFAIATANQGYIGRITEVMRNLDVTPVTHSSHFFDRVNVGGGVRITNKRGHLANTVHIPQYIAGQRVVQIAPMAFFGQYNITSLVVPDSVNYIGLGAFYGMSRLQSITTPLMGAANTGRANTPFGHIFGASHHSYQYDFVPSTLRTVTIRGATSVQAYAFRNLSGITALSLPNNLTRIERNAFMGTSVRVMSIPHSVEYMGSGIFAGMRYMTTLNIPFLGSRENTNAYIGHLFGARSAQTQNSSLPSSLRTVTIAGGTHLYERAFYGAVNITAINLPDTINTIPRYSFARTGLVDFSVPASLWGIDVRLFYGSRDLRIVRIRRGAGSTTLKDTNAFGGRAGQPPVRVIMGSGFGAVSTVWIAARDARLIDLAMF